MDDCRVEVYLLLSVIINYFSIQIMNNEKLKTQKFFLFLIKGQKKLFLNDERVNNIRDMKIKLFPNWI